MIIVKFIVLFGCIIVLSALQTYYCDICLNHTLCLYNIPGPSATCNSYVSTALLSKQEIQELVYKINEIRNYIATGDSGIFPKAANMKMIHWSPELATFAQRWVDQCHPSVSPDKEDECRDLDNMEVGQNIASVIDPSRSVSAKGFVDAWFRKSLEYSGSISIYNQLRDNKTNHFTQLIWAETVLFGCAKAKFYVEDMKVFIERLVCNFAPKGNIHGKPVYSIGYAGIQCADNMAPNKHYKGLCEYQDTAKLRKLMDNKNSAKSLLRILNLSNDTAKHERDTVHNNPKQLKRKIKRQRSQKTRHILSTNGHGTLRRASIRRQNYKKFVQNMSRNINDDHHQHERGHSRLYHGYQEPEIIESTTRAVEPPTYYFQKNNNQYSRNYDSATSGYLISSPNYRKFLQNVHCTRKSNVNQNDNCNEYRCSRHDCCSQTSEQQSETFTNPIIPDRICPCITTSKCPIVCPPLSSTPNNFNMNCKYANMANMFRRMNHEIVPEISMAKEKELMHGLKPNKIYNTVHGIKKISDDINDESGHSKYSRHDHDYLYHSFDSSLRKKRQNEDKIASTPFWKMNDLSFKKTFPTVKYTTLPNINNRKTKRRIQSNKGFDVTESITIKREQYPNEAVYDRIEENAKTTEKYLSFDELMYLRKFSNSYMDSNIRRQGGRRANTKGNQPTSTVKKTTTTEQTTTAIKLTTVKKTIATTKNIARNTQPTTQFSMMPFALDLVNYTANTQFERKKHCTRKLTCSWTAFSGIAGEINGNPIKEFGSHTPPGYVEGCSRTSTCTRDYMNRNKIATAPSISTTDLTTHADIHEDGDYCEKRSLDIRKRNSDLKDFNRIPQQKIVNSDTDSVSGSIFKEHDYIFNKKIKYKQRKRTALNSGSKLLTYPEIYQLILNNIIRRHQVTHETKNCPCNFTTDHTKFPIVLYLLCYIFYLMLVIIV